MTISDINLKNAISNITSIQTPIIQEQTKSKSKVKLWLNFGFVHQYRYIKDGIEQIGERFELISGTAIDNWCNGVEPKGFDWQKTQTVLSNETKRIIFEKANSLEAGQKVMLKLDTGAGFVLGIQILRTAEVSTADLSELDKSNLKETTNAVTSFLNAFV